jgi:hypothetical protein
VALMLLKSLDAIPEKPIWINEKSI